jgi:hypothetical protein
MHQPSSSKKHDKKTWQENLEWMRMLPGVGGLKKITLAGFRPIALAPLGPRLVAIGLMAGTMTLAGCARHAATRDLHPGRHYAGTPGLDTRQRAETHPGQIYRGQRQSTAQRVRWPEAALLAPQQGPDCEFRGANIGAMDASELARLKIEFERQCFQDAERAARDRLNSLQAAVRKMRD